jgi:hypothetical protein
LKNHLIKAAVTGGLKDELGDLEPKLENNTIIHYLKPTT